MSSRIRFIAQIGSYSFSGAKAKKKLAEQSGLPVRTVKEAITAAKYSGSRLWIFKEPRKLKTSKSRYKKFCCLLGIGRAKRKVQWAGLDAVVPQGYIAVPAPPQQHAQIQFIQHYVGGQNGAAQPGPANPIAVDDEPF